jgi:hypothetical protein
MQDDIYYQKYLKYKAKYIALKQQEGGLITLNSGTYVFFCNDKYTSQICSAIHANAPSNAKLNEILSKTDVSYRGKNGGKSLVVVSQSRLHKGTALAKQGVSNVASKAGQAVSNVASKAGQAVSDVASKAGQAVSNTASKIGQAVSDTASRAGQAVSNTASKVGQAVSSTASIVGQAASNIASSAKSQAKFIATGIKTTKHIDDVVKVGGALPADELVLSTPINTADESNLRELINKLQKIDESINTAVVIEIKSVGSNKCLSIIKA